MKEPEAGQDPIRIMPDELGPLPKGVDPFERCNLWLLYTTLRGKRIGPMYRPGGGLISSAVAPQTIASSRSGDFRSAGVHEVSWDSRSKCQPR